MGLRLGFHYHVRSISINGGIYMPGVIGRFVDSLAQFCQEIVCFLYYPKPEDMGFLDYRISSPNVALINIGPLVSVPERLASFRQYVRPIRDWRDALDGLIIRGPNHLLPFMAKAANGIPLILLLVGDYLAGVNDIAQPLWRKEAIRIYARWNKWQQLKVARRSLTFVNSRLLYDQMRAFVPNLYETRTTTLSTDDFYERPDTCLSPPYRLLFTGRLSREKGLLDMVEALDLLIKMGKDVVLDIVGWNDSRNENILEQVYTLATERGIPDRIHYHGYKALGPELFAFYKDADLFVIASRSSEGFPRSIWEAMAHSVPVVATRVGAIPFYLQNLGQAVLVEPRNPHQLAGGIARLLEDTDLRAKMISEGQTMARNNTLETRAREFIAQIEKWLPAKTR